MGESTWEHCKEKNFNSGSAKGLVNSAVLASATTRSSSGRIPRTLGKLSTECASDNDYYNLRVHCFPAADGHSSNTEASRTILRIS